MNDRSVLCALLRQDFFLFLTFAFREIGGQGEYQHNWHIDAIKFQLDRIARGENRRLIITMPPRHLKSTAVTIAWIAWLLGHNPALRFIAVSYGIELSEKFARETLKIMDSWWFRAAFPKLVLTRRAVLDLETSEGGGRLATSLGGTLTGRGADYIVIDDPTKSKDAASESVRDSDKAWLFNTLMTRLNDPATGAIILVMQRLHEGDVAGELIERGGWDELRLPAIAMEDHCVQMGESRFYRRRAGHPLHGARQPLSVLYQLRREMGSHNFAAQCQQQPLPATGNIVKADWLKTYPGGFEASSLAGKIVQSWDTATKDGVLNDWSVCITAHVSRNEIRILDVYRRRLLFPDLKAAAIRMARQYGATHILIEDQASGSQLLQTLRSEQPSGVPHPIARRPEGDKYSRMAGVSGQIEGGQLLLPENAPWLGEFLTELLGFPNARHDDQADALTQLMSWIMISEPAEPQCAAGPVLFWEEDGISRSVGGEGLFGQDSCRSGDNRHDYDPWGA